VPEALVRRVIQIESRGNARVIHNGNYGLMQIRLGTARGMGYRGSAEGLLDPDTNMTYAVKYLAGAYRAAGCQEDRAISYYQRGYYGRSRTACRSRPSALSLWTGSTDAERTQAVSDQSDAARDETLKPRVVRVETIVRQPKETTRAVVAFAVPVPESKAATSGEDANAAAPASRPRSERQMSRRDAEGTRVKSKFREAPKRKTKSFRRSKSRVASTKIQKTEEPSLIERLKNFISPSGPERKPQGSGAAARAGAQPAGR
jgi:hypothetical protein